MVDHMQKSKKQPFNLAVKDKWVFKEKTIYEFNINLNDEYQNKSRDPFQRYTVARGHVSSILSKSRLTYCLIPELSMNQYGDKYTNTYSRIHWHGLVYFPDNLAILDYLLRIDHVLKKIGRIQFNPHRPDYWKKYCHKHQHIFKSLKNISRHGVTYEEFLSAYSPDVPPSENIDKNKP